MNLEFEFLAFFFFKFESVCISFSLTVATLLMPKFQLSLFILSLSPRGLLYYYLEATNVGIEVGNLCVYCKCSLSAKKI